MFLSHIQLNPARRTGRPLLTSPHTLHAAVLAAFPDPSPRDTGRVLWRLDVEPHRTHLYVVSPEPPDLTHIAEQAGWPTREDSWQVRPYAPLLDRIENDHRYLFRLTANPVRSKRLPGGARGKVYGHVTARQQEQWLLERQERLGIRVDLLGPDEIETPPDADPPHALLVKDRRTLSFTRRETAVTLRVATYEGRLIVADRDRFVHALGHGIGRAKGYGCGLMTIAPVR